MEAAARLHGGVVQAPPPTKYDAGTELARIFKDPKCNVALW